MSHRTIYSISCHRNKIVANKSWITVYGILHVNINVISFMHRTDNGCMSLNQKNNMNIYMHTSTANA